MKMYKNEEVDETGKFFLAQVFGYVAYAAGRTMSSEKTAYALSSAVLFASGFLSRGCELWNMNEYSANNVRVVNMKIGSEHTGEHEVRLLEVNGKTLYVPKTDNKGNITGLCRLEKIVSDLETRETYVECVELTVRESDNIRISAKKIQ